MNPLRSIRLTPNDAEFLNQRFNNGDLYYDSSQKTLVLYDGQIIGGVPLLRADLSNLVGGGGAGAGNINFGSNTITAQAFVGDGSLLTNLPIPSDLATISYVNSRVPPPATTTQLGTIKVGLGLSITSDGVLTADAVGNLTSLDNLDSIGLKRGVPITEFSLDGTMSDNANDTVPTESAVKTYVDTSISTAVSNIDLAANGTVNSGNAGRFAVYNINGNSVFESSANLTWNDTTSTLAVRNLNVSNEFQALSGGTVTGTLSVTSLITTPSINSQNIFYDGTGIIRFTSGSDFIIDAPGEVNVSGSRISNLGTPIEDTDAVNKEYVDGAASQFTGGEVPNPISITANTTSTSTTTGSLIVTGGVGISGSLYAGGTIYMSGSPVLTSLSGGFNGGTISGVVFINNSTASTSTTSGALRVTGGVGVGRSIYTGGDSYFNGIRFGNGSDIGAGYAQNVAIGGGTGINAPLGSNISGVNDICIGYSTMGQISDASDSIAIGNEVMANKTIGGQNIGIGTNALRENQSIGNLALGYSAGSLLLTGDNNVIIGSSTGSTIDGTDNNVLISDGLGNIKILFNSAGAFGLGGATYGTSGQVLTSGGTSGIPTWADPAGFVGGNVAGAAAFTNSTSSLSSSTGAVVVTGGVGIGENLNVNGTIFANSGIQNTPIGSSSANTGAFTTIGASGQVTITNNNASTGTANGALVITGGVGIGGATNIASSLSAGGTVTFTQNSAATNTSTGTLRITGGMGVTGTIYAGGFNGPLAGNATTATTATSATQFAGVGAVSYAAALRANRQVTGGGTITVNAAGSVLWSTRFIVISNGSGSTFGVNGYFDINCPTSGTITGVGGHANVTATAAGITMGAWDALYYILPIGGSATSSTANFRIASYVAALDVPYNWILLALRNGDDGVFSFPNGINLELSQSVATINATQTRQFDSLGVGTAPSGTTGEIRATSEVTAYFSSDKNLKENIVTIDNALGKLRQVSGVMFDWTDDEIERRGGEDGYFVRKHDTGIIAQDVEKVLPEVVAVRPDGYKAVKYEKLAGLIIQAINELADQVDEIKKKLN